VVNSCAFADLRCTSPSREDKCFFKLTPCSEIHLLMPGMISETDWQRSGNPERLRSARIVYIYMCSV